MYLRFDKKKSGKACVAVGVLFAVLALLPVWPRVGSSSPMTIVFILYAAGMAISGLVMYFWPHPKEKHLPGLTPTESRIIAAYRRGDTTLAIKIMVDE